MPDEASRNLKNSILLIDKSAGVTSFDIINKLKKLIGTKKIGHSGTLDKFASGLLVVCTGWTTKLTRYFLESDKKYTGTIRLGISTDTIDSLGEITEKRGILHLDREKIPQIREIFTGELMQLPPVYSALKIGGRRASDLTREGIEVNLIKRKVHIRKLDILKIDLDNSILKLEVICSKGTYIRSLARDIGIFLDTGAYLENLQRTASGLFSIENAVTTEEISAYLRGIKTDKKFCVKPEDVLPDFGYIMLDANTSQKVLNGSIFSKEEIKDINIRPGKPFRIYNEEKNLIAIAEADINNWSIKYLNVFNMKE